MLRRSSLVMVVLALALGTPASGQFVAQKDIFDLEVLHTRIKNATREDREIARKMLLEASIGVKEGRYGFAFKIFGESASRVPTIEALLGMAEAISFLGRDRKNCAEQVLAKTRDLGKAARLIGTALALQKELGGSAADTKAGNQSVELFHRHLQMLAQRQQDLAISQIACAKTLESK